MFDNLLLPSSSFSMIKLFFIFLLFFCTAPNSPQSIFITSTQLLFIHQIAGLGDGTGRYSGDGGDASNASFNAPLGIWKDSLSNLYICDSQNYRIRKIDSLTNIITTVVGTGQMNDGSGGYTHGIARQTPIMIPTSIVGDANFFYFSDVKYIWRYNFSSENISVIVGTSLDGYNGDNHLGLSTLIEYPKGLWLTTESSYLYFVDSLNQIIRKINLQSQIVTTIAGIRSTGTADFTYSDNLNPLDTPLQYPCGVYVDTIGQIFIDDIYNNWILKIGTDGRLRQFAGAQDPLPNKDGFPATLSPLSLPNDIKGDSLGNIYIADSTCAIRKVDATTSIMQTIIGNLTFCGPTGSVVQDATQTYIRQPQALYIDPDGSIYFSDGSNSIYYVFDSTRSPSISPSTMPWWSGQPWSPPTRFPTAPTFSPSLIPSFSPTCSPSELPTTPPSCSPTYSPTIVPTFFPSRTPSEAPSYSDPTLIPTILPSNSPTLQPTTSPSVVPTIIPTNSINPPQLIVKKITGIGTYGFSGDNDLAINAALNIPGGIWKDSMGNLYICDGGNHRVRVIDTAQIITTIAGTSIQSSDGINGPATSVSLMNPYDIVGDNNYFYFSDLIHIWKYDFSSKNVTVLVGTSQPGFNGDGMIGTLTQIANPLGLWLTNDADQQLFFADGDNAMIRVISLTTHIVTTLINSGIYGPSAVLVIQDKMFICDQSNHRIEVVQPVISGTISTFAGIEGVAGYSVDGQSASNAALTYPSDIKIDSLGNLYIADYGNCVIQKVDVQTTIISTIVGIVQQCSVVSVNIPTPATTATFDKMQSLYIDSDGIIYFSDALGDVYSVFPGTASPTTSPTNVPSLFPSMIPSMIPSLPPSFFPSILPTLVPTSLSSLTPSRAPSTGPTLTPTVLPSISSSSPSLQPSTSISVVPTVIPTNSINSPQLVVRRIAGLGTSDYSGDNGLAINATLNLPFGIWKDSVGNLYICDGGNYRVRKIDTAQIITTIAGNSIQSSDGINGPATSVSLQNPYDIVGDNNYFYFSDLIHIWKYDFSSKNVTVLVGTSQPGFNGDGMIGTMTQIDNPEGLWLTTDAGQQLFFADGNNAMIRVISLTTHIVTTLINTGVYAPSAVLVIQNKMFICDQGNHKIQVVQPIVSGTISTYAGRGVAGPTGDGQRASNAGLNIPSDIKIDSLGNLYIADYANCVIRKVDAQTTIISTIVGILQHCSFDSLNTPTPATISTFYQIQNLYIDSDGIIYFSDALGDVYSASPTGSPTNIPSLASSCFPSLSPSVNPSTLPSLSPTYSPSLLPTFTPTIPPTAAPTVVPSSPSFSPTYSPSSAQTILPTCTPTRVPTLIPTVFPSSENPSRHPSAIPSVLPSIASPNVNPSTPNIISIIPSVPPSLVPSISPSLVPTFYPSLTPSHAPSTGPTSIPTVLPSIISSSLPTLLPANSPSVVPTIVPTNSINSPQLTVKKITGIGIYDYSGDNGPANNAALNIPGGIWKDSMGNLYICDGGNYRVRMIDTAQIITTIAGNSIQSGDGINGPATSVSLMNPYDIVGDDNYFYFSDLIYIWKYDFSSKNVTVLVGTSQSGFNGDGMIGTMTNINSAEGLWLTTGPDKQLLFADGNGMIRVISLTTQIVTTLINTDLSGPSAVLVFQDKMFICDQNNHRIQVVHPIISGSVSTFAGVGVAGQSGDGQHASNAALYLPSDIKMDSLGNFYIADFGNCAIRKIDAQTTIISTIVGILHHCSINSINTPTPATIATFDQIQHLYIDNDDVLYFSDALGDVYSVYPETASPTISPTYIPSIIPSLAPSLFPSSATPSRFPSHSPTYSPSLFPTILPTLAPTKEPTLTQTAVPSFLPSKSLSRSPSTSPSVLPSIASPNINPSTPSIIPSVGIQSLFPSVFPSETPTIFPSVSPNFCPSSLHPTFPPSPVPSFLPTPVPTTIISPPSTSPISAFSSSSPTTLLQTDQPSIIPTYVSSLLPTLPPTDSPILFSSTSAPGPTTSTDLPTNLPSSASTTLPSSIVPTVSNTINSATSVDPSVFPSADPTTSPVPTESPSFSPTLDPNIPQTTEPSAFITPNPQILSLLPSTVSPRTSTSNAPNTFQSRIPSTRPSLLSSNPSIAPIPTSIRPTIQPNTFTTPPLAQRFNQTLILPMKPFHGVENLLLTGRSLFGGSNQKRKTSVGVSFIVFGQKDQFSDVSLDHSHLIITQDVLFQNPNSYSIANLHDINGDQLDDLIVCDPLNSNCYLCLGQDKHSSWIITNSLSGESPLDYFGWSVASIDDINRDSLADFVVCALRSKNCYVLFGRSSFEAEFSMSQLTLSTGFKISASSKLISLWGVAIASAGDFNGDGIPDIVISAMDLSSDFTLFVIYGQQTLTNIDIKNWNPTLGFKIQCPSRSLIGLSLAGLGDVNMDGYDDLIIGSLPYEMGKYSTQKSYVIFGTNNRNVLNLTEIVTGIDGFVISGGGFMVAAPGDVNNDGIPDILVSSYSDWQGKGNGYVIMYPHNLTSSPTFLPSETPSLSSQQPTSSPSRTTISPSDQPNAISKRPTGYPTTFSPTTVKPSKFPTFFPSKAPRAITSKPVAVLTNRPSFAHPLPGPTIQPTTLRPSFRATPLPSSHPISFPTSIPTVLNETDYLITEITSSGTYQGRNGAEVFLISNPEGKVIIETRGRGKKIYWIYPSIEDSWIYIEEFLITEDIIDLSYFKDIQSLSEISYATHPLTLILSDKQEILIGSDEEFDLTTSNFFFASSSSSYQQTTTYQDIIKANASWILLPILFFGLIFLGAKIAKEDIENVEQQKKGKKVKKRSGGEVNAEEEEADEEANVDFYISRAALESSQENPPSNITSKPPVSVVPELTPATHQRVFPKESEHPTSTILKGEDKPELELKRENDFQAPKQLQKELKDRRKSERKKSKSKASPPLSSNSLSSSSSSSSSSELQSSSLDDDDDDNEFALLEID